ncbi:unnamed protein product [Cuscuta campestris]|uniref:DUF4283 domain-containing protein n=1 Tax=Cuscuta campestris TaxID=132261 RepID=A0A484KYF0_9ASTE|nr:unnamed protein product [Cuscuta campestris]
MDVQDCLVGKLLTTNPFNAKAMKNVLRAAWKPQKDLLIREVIKNLLVFQLFSLEDKLSVLRTGPLVFDGYLLLIRELGGNEQPEGIWFSFVDFWVRVYDIPFRKRNKAGVETVYSKVVRVLEMDETDI